MGYQSPYAARYGSESPYAADVSNTPPPYAQYVQAMQARGQQPVSPEAYSNLTTIYVNGANRSSGGQGASGTGAGLASTAASVGAQKGMEYGAGQLFGGGSAAAAPAATAATTSGTGAAAASGAGVGIEGSVGAGGGSSAGLGAAAAAAIPVAGTLGALALIGKDYNDAGKGNTKGAGQWANRGLTAWSTFGASELARALGVWGQKPKTEVEEGRWKALEKQGIAVPDYAKLDVKDPHAWYRQDLKPSWIGQTPDGWVNNKFALTRDARDLNGRDIWGYAAWAEKAGNKWAGTSEQNREEIANEALKRNLVKEHHGTVDINWTPEFKAYVDSKLTPPPAPKTNNRRK